MTTLKPCPFCGKQVALIDNCHELEDCENFERCEATGYYAVVCDVNEGGCGASGGYARTEQEAIAAWNRRSDVAPVVHGEWNYIIEKGSCMDYQVTAKCSECGWDWFSKEGVGNYSAVFSAFITNCDSRPEEAKRFLLENARANNKLNYCPNCGAKMDKEAQDERND